MNKKYLLKIKKRLLLYATVISIAILISECSSEKEEDKVLKKEVNYENYTDR